MKAGTLLAIAGIIASSFAIFIRVMTPTTIQFIIEGNIIELREIPNIYNSVDLVITGVSSFILGSSLIYLAIVSKNSVSKVEAPLKRNDWDRLLEGVSDADERKIIHITIEAGGTIFQSQLVEQSGYSKSKVSLVLDRLEAKKLLERRRRGMSNVIVLK